MNVIGSDVAVLRPWYDQLKIGEKVLFLGREVTVIQKLMSEADWKLLRGEPLTEDDEEELTYPTGVCVAWWSDGGLLQSKCLPVEDAYELLSATFNAAFPGCG